MRTSSSKVRRTVFAVLAVLLLAAVWLSGVYVGRKGAFPYDLLKSGLQLVTNGEAVGSNSVQPVSTVLVPLTRAVYDNDGPVKLTGWGGGLAAVAGSIVGVDSRGVLFRYEGRGRFRTLPFTIDMNAEEYRAYLASMQPDAARRAEVAQRFRVLDLEAYERDDKITLFASYDYWHADSLGKTVRVARLVLDGGSGQLTGEDSGGEAKWEVLYETTPMLPFSLVMRSPFNSDRSGGRIVVDSSNGLLVSIGDHFFDGVRYPSAPQDTASSFGKVIRINLETLRSEIFTTGNRNPQGLTVDRDGNVWETEHGAKGGDELNLLRKGVDYGWPAATYGTDYGRYSWPPNARQGRHDVGEKPVFSWVPSIATSNLIQVKKVPARWDGDLLVSSLRGASLFRVRVEEGHVRFVEPVLIGERIRDLIQMENGTVLMWTDAAHFIELTVDEDVLAADTELPLALTPSEMAAGLNEIVPRCLGCHRMQPGPSWEPEISLWGVYGRGIATTDYPAYSNGLKARHGTWTDEELQSFLLSPSTYAPGSFMPDPGLRDPAVAKALVGYLKRLR